MKRIFYPNKYIGLPLFMTGFLLIIYVFTFHLEDTGIAYISYLWSAYSLILFSIWFIKACHFSNQYIKDNSRIYKYYLNNYDIITKIFLFFSMVLNFIYGIYEFAFGIYFKSFWLITLAVYYLVLWMIKFSLIKNIKSNKFGANIEIEFNILRRTGVILLFMNIVLIGIVILLLRYSQVIKYNGYMIYVVALYDFYLIISAFINVFKYHKNKSPILIASKYINLTVAMISILSLEVAMIYQFGDVNSNFKTIVISITGLFVISINTIMAIYIIINSNKNLSLKYIQITIDKVD